MSKKGNHNKEKSKTKKKSGSFYKISFSVILIASILLFYFAVLVSIGPKSIELVTKKIEERVVKDFGEGSSIDDSKISFTAYGSLKVSVVGLNIFYSNQEAENREFYTIPRIEAEFPLLNLFFLNFQPTKIKVVKPLIVINDVSNLKQVKQDSLEQEAQLSAIISLLFSIQKGENPIENFEIEDAKFIVFNANQRTDILIKKSQIQAFKKKELLFITAQNQISFDEKKSDVNLDSNCQFSKTDGFRCDLFLTNFSPDSVSNLNKKFADLAKIDANFDINISLAVKERKLGNVVFKARSNFGSLNFPEFFESPLTFKNFSAAGEYDNQLKILNISEIESDFVTTNSLQKQVEKNPHLSMSVIFSAINEEQKTSQLYIKLQNVLTDDLNKFWPVSLNQNSIRSWVVEHIKGGVIKSAYAKFSLNHKKEIELEDIDSQVILSKANLNYDSSFPKISNISAIANFSNNDMKITISDGEVLESKITKGFVEIADFSAANTILKIKAEVKGNPADGLAHASNNEKFIAESKKYLNGKADTKVDVILNLSKEVTLKNSYIAIDSKVENLKNDYVKGAAAIKSKKIFGSTNFISNIDLTKSEISIKELGIDKKSGVEAAVDFIVSVLLGGSKIEINKLHFSEKNKNSKITASIAFNGDDGSLEKLNFRNYNFGNNDYNIVFDDNQKTKNSEIYIRGSNLNFGPVVSSKIFKEILTSDDNSSSKKFRLYLPRVELLNGKVLRNFSLAFNSRNGLFYYGLMQGSYFNKDFINLKLSKDAEDNFSEIAGEISELGYLAEGFGISNVVSGGNAKIKIKNTSVNNKSVFEGDIKVDEDITIYETPTVKKFSKDDLFSKIRDKIFSSEKTTFSLVKIKFDFKDNVLNLQSLIANNYKIGITAKGFFDIDNSTYQLKGMIIPGFLINNLFGIGNIPLIGGVISGILTGGEGGGVFGLKYEYVKDKDDKEGKFSTNKISAFVPSTIQNLFDF
jgi:hypothetical protein